MAQFPPRPSGSEAEAFRQRRRGRNIAFVLVLAGLAALFYAVTIVKLVHP